MKYQAKSFDGTILLDKMIKMMKKMLFPISQMILVQMI